MSVDSSLDTQLQPLLLPVEGLPHHNNVPKSILVLADITKWCATDIVWFCGFSLRNAILTRTDTIAGSLLVLTFSEAVVIKAG